jgi:hypothetical protein
MLPASGEEKLKALIVDGQSKLKVDAKVATGPIGDKFQDYTVQIQVDGVQRDKSYTLKSFTDETGVFVKLGSVL